MLPSDHFVRMYNELFKMLAERSQDDLKNYWLEIASLQDTIIGPEFREKGFQGMFLTSAGTPKTPPELLLHLLREPLQIGIESPVKRHVYGQRTIGC